MEENVQNEEHKKQTKKQLFWEIFRFLLVGGTATIVDYAAAYVFYHWLLPPSIIGQTPSLIISTAVGFCFGLTVNWLLSITFVFRQVTDEKASRSKKSFLIFTIIGLIGLAITEVGMHLGVTMLPEITIFKTTEFLGEAWKWWISKVVMTCIVLVWNYVGRKVLVFK